MGTAVVLILGAIAWSIFWVRYVDTRGEPFDITISEEKQNIDFGVAPFIV